MIITPFKNPFSARISRGVSFNPADYNVYNYWNTSNQTIVGTTTTQQDIVGSLDMANPDAGSQPTYNAPFQTYLTGDYLNVASVNYRVSDTSGVITGKFKPTIATGIQGLFQIATDGNNRVYIYYINKRLRIAVLKASVGVYLQYAVDLVLNDEYVYSFYSTGSSLKLVLNGTLRTLTPVAGSNTGQWLAYVNTSAYLRIGEGQSDIQYTMYSQYISDLEVLNLNNELVGLEAYSSSF